MTHLFPPVRHFLAVMLLFAGLTSCIKEDLSDCPPPAPPAPVEVETRIRPDFIPYSEETGEGFEASELKTLTVFAFDSHGRFVTKATDNAPRLGEADYRVTLTLRPGRYDFYAWGNARDCYRFVPEAFIPGETTATDIRLQYDCPSNDTVNVALPPLFFGSLKDAEVKPDTRADIAEQTLTIPLVRDTYDLTFELSGLAAGLLFEVVVTDNNTVYGFDNSFLQASSYIHYCASCTREVVSGIYRSSLTDLRLERDRAPRFKLYNRTTGELVFHDDLIHLILASEEVSGRKIDFSRRYNYRISLDFSETDESGNTTISVSVNGWQVVKQNVTVDLSKPNLP